MPSRKIRSNKVFLKPQGEVITLVNPLAPTPEAPDGYIRVKNPKHPGYRVKQYIYVPKKVVLELYEQKRPRPGKRERLILKTPPAMDLIGAYQKQLQNELHKINPVRIL